MRLVLRVEELVAALAKQFGWRVSEQPDDTLIDKTELAVHRVPRDELGGAVRARHVASIRRRGYLKAADRYQAAVGRVEVLLRLTVYLNSCEHV